MIDYTWIDLALTTILIPVVSVGLKVWADQRSDQRAWRHDKQNREQGERNVQERLERLESRTEAAIRLEGEVANLRGSLERVERMAEDVRRTSEDNNSILKYLEGRADERRDKSTRTRRDDRDDH